MTVIEFFSDDPIENVVSMLTLEPLCVKVLCEPQKEAQAKAQLKGLAASLDRPPTVEILSRNMTDISMICETLESLLTNDVRVDLTGGSETAIMALGRVAEKLAPTLTVPMHRFDLNAGTACCVPSGEALTLIKPPMLTVEQFVWLHGGETAGSSNGGALRTWELSSPLTTAVEAVWNAYTEEPERWNSDIKALLECVKYRKRGRTPLEIVLDDRELSQNVRHYEEKSMRVQRLLARLEKHGAVQRLEKGTFCYASAEVKHCLAKEGNALEMMTLVTAMRARSSEGNKVFCDAKCGVYLDWSGRFGEPDNTHNEVDVVLMHGVRPVFISCKNGEVPADEPFKLRAVADRFGGERAVAALIATEPLPDALQVRVEQMGIHLLNGVHRLTADAFKEQLMKLVIP